MRTVCNILLRLLRWRVRGNSPLTHLCGQTTGFHSGCHLQSSGDKVLKCLNTGVLVKVVRANSVQVYEDGHHVHLGVEKLSDCVRRLSV